MVVNRSISVPTEVEIGVIGKIDNSRRVRCRGIANGQNAGISRETKSEGYADIARVAFISVGTQKAQRERRCRLGRLRRLRRNR